MKEITTIKNNTTRERHELSNSPGYLQKLQEFSDIISTYFGTSAEKLQESSDIISDYFGTTMDDIKL